MPKKEKEMKRQVIHILLGIVILLLFYFDLINTLSMLIVTVVGVVISVISRKKKIPVINWFLKQFERKRHISTFPGKGALFFLIGSMLVMFLFEKDIALASIAILTFGDSFSHIAGVYLGRTKQPFSPKLIEGTAIGIFAAFIAASFFVPVLEAFIAAFIAMSVEAIEIRIDKSPIDDNFIIPVLAGVVISAIRFVI